METILNINTFDAIVIGLIVLLSLKGLISGFTKELFNAIGIIGGIFLATFFNKDVALYISENFAGNINIKILELISLIAIFIIVLIVSKLIYKIIVSISSDDYISPASRLTGMLIKLITLFFIFALIVYSFSSKPQITEKFKDTFANSKLYPILKSSGAAILNVSNLIDGGVITNGNENNSSKDANNTTKLTDLNSSKEDNKTVIESNSTQMSKSSIESNQTLKENNTEINNTDSNSSLEKNITSEVNSSQQ